MTYTAIVKIYKYSHFKWEETVEIEADNKDIAKKMLQEVAASTQWAMDLTPIPDLRTLKIKKI